MVSASCPDATKRTASASGLLSGSSLPPPGETSTRYWENVSAKPESGRARTQRRVSVQFGRKLVTMSVSTPLGMTA